MEFDDVVTSRALVQSINVLRYQVKIAAVLLHCRQGGVTRIGLRCRNQFAPPCVPSPHPFRIGCERLGRSKLQRIIGCPKTGLGIAKGGHTTLGRDARAGESRYTSRTADQRSGL